MLRSFLFFLFLLSYTFSFCQLIDKSHPDYKAYYFDNGNLSSEGSLIDGKPNNYWVAYYENGNKKSEGNRSDFLLDGLWKFYHEEGWLTSEINYKENKKNGAYKIYNKEGDLLRLENYENDKKEGKAFYYFAGSKDSTLKIKKLIPYTNDLENGIALRYAADGRIIKISNYKNGFLTSTEKINQIDTAGLKQGLWKTYFPNMRLNVEKRYKNDKLNGYYKTYSKNGELISAVLYIDGIEQDKESNLADFDINYEYFENGEIKSTTTYNKGGNKDGVSMTYNKDGEIVASKLYRNGYLLAEGIIDKEGLYQGKWKHYYLNGNIKSEGNYIDGKKVEKWIFYFTNGKIEQTGNYDKNGKFTGMWKWYYENGNILRTEEFRRGVEDGYLEEFSVNGEIITKGEYFEGEKEGEWFYQLNDHLEEGKYRYGQRNGYWVFKHPNGKLAFEGNFIEGIPDGKHKYFSQDGLLEKEENYSYGIKEGKWKWYDSNGFEQTSITYKDGKERKINGQKVKFDKGEQ